jgi:hypothetical protein
MPLQLLAMDNAAFAEEPRASNWHGYCGNWPRI